MGRDRPKWHILPLTTIGVHLECAIQAEMVVELDLIERK